MGLEQRLARLEALRDEPPRMRIFVVDLGDDNDELLEPLEPGRRCIDLGGEMGQPYRETAKDVTCYEPGE